MIVELQVIITLSSFIFNFIQPTISTILGSLVFHLYKIDRDKEKFSLNYVIKLIIVAGIVGYYSNHILKYYAPQPLVNALGFIVGLMAKVVFDSFLNSETMQKIFKRLTR